MVTLVPLLFLVAQGGCKISDGGLHLSRTPSLQQCAPDSAVIAWKTSEPSRTSRRYGLEDRYDHEIQDAARTEFHAAVLRGLQPNTTYHYRVVVGGRVAYSSHFRTYPGPEDARAGRFGFWVIGDGGSGNAHQRAVRDQLRRVIAAGKVDFGLYTGDIVYEDGEEEDQDPDYFIPYRHIIDEMVWWTAPGNHDLHEDQGEPYYRNRVLPAAPKFADLRHADRWYAFTFGDALFIALDSNDPEDPRQREFLQWTLEQAADKMWKFVFLHHPAYATPYQDEGDCSHTSDMRVREAWAPLFEKFEVDIVFCGHSHTYQRSQLVKEYFPAKRGVYYIVTGGGGAKVHTVNDFDANCNTPPLQQAFVKSDTHHFVYVTIDGERLALRAVDEAGRQFDSFVIRKASPQGTTVSFHAGR